MNLKILAATILYQSRMVFRQKIFWFIQGISLLIVYVNVFQMMGNDASEADFVASIVGKGLCIFLSLAAGFLVVPAVMKNSGRISELLWATPLRVMEFVLGLFFGIYLPLAVIVVMTFIFHYLGTFIPGATAITPSLDLMLSDGLLPVLVVMALSTSIYLALSMLLRSPMAVYTLVGIFWVAWLSGIIEPTVTLLSPLNFGLMTFTLSKTVGLGLDQPLVSSLLGLWLSIEAAILIMLPWLFTWKHPLDYPRIRKSSVGLFIIGIVIVAIAWGNFSKVVKAALVPPASEDWQLNTWQVLNRNTQVELKEGRVKGESKLILENSGETSTDKLLLVLNPGLEVNSITWQDKLLYIERDGGAVRVSLPIPIEPGQSVDLTIKYYGKFIVPREDYAQSYALRGSLVQKSLPVQAYLAKNFGYLKRDGNWEPWPYSGQIHLAKNENFLSIKVLEHRGAVLSSASTIHTDSRDTSQYSWNGDIPPALLAYGLIEVNQTNSADLAYYFVKPDDKDQSNSHEYVKILKEFLKWYGDEPPASIMAAQLPYLTEPVWGNGILFYPELSQVMTYLKGITWRNPTTEEVERYRAYEISLAWWHASIHWPSAPLIYSPDSNPQMPYGRIVPVSTDTFDKALAWYSAIHLMANWKQNPGLVDREVAFWQEVLDLNPTSMGQTMDTIVNRQTLYSKLVDHGIPYSDWNPDRLGTLASNIVALDKVYHASGDQSFKELLHLVCQRYAPDQNESLSMESFFGLSISDQEQTIPAIVLQKQPPQEGNDDY
jgi:hypothetical protein